MRMTHYGEAPILSDVTETDVEMDQSLLDVYKAVKLAAVMRGETVWVRREFDVTQPITYDLYNSRRYLGSVAESAKADGFRVHALGSESEYSEGINGATYPLDQAQSILATIIAPPDILPPGTSI